MKYIAFGKEQVENVRFLMMLVLLEMCDVVVKVNKLYVLFKNKVWGFFCEILVKDVLPVSYSKYSQQ